MWTLTLEFRVCFLFWHLLEAKYFFKNAIISFHLSVGDQGIDILEQE